MQESHHNGTDFCEERRTAVVNRFFLFLQQDSQQQQQQEFNIPVMCRIGQETVQEIVSRAGELFQLLRTLGPPTGSMNPQASTVQEVRTESVVERYSFNTKLSNLS